MGKDSASGNRLIANNKKAYFDYFIEDKLEAGLELCGTEVKSRPKKLLLHKSEINKLAGQLSTKGYTLVPLQVYLKYGKVKMQIGLAKGKKNYDKRDSIAKKDQQREAAKDFKIRNLG